MNFRTRIVIVITLFLLVVSAHSQDDTVVITLSYNAFLQNSFGEGPPPLEVIQTEVTNRYPNYQIELSIAPDSIEAWRDQLSIAFTAQDGTIDIYGMDTPWVLEFGQAGWAVPLDQAIEGWTDNYVPSGLDIFSYDQQVLAIPFWGSVGGLFYRTDILDAYGYDAPTTYDELFEIARDITTQDETLTGFVWAGAREEGLIQVWAEFFIGFGGEYFDEAGNCAINSQAGIDAVTYMTNLIESGVSPRQVVTWDAAASRVRFVEGQAIFLRHNADIVTFLDDEERTAISGLWDITSNPAQENGRSANATGGFGFAMNPFSDTYEETLNVMEIIAGINVQEGFARAWGPVQYYDGLYELESITDAFPNADAITRLLPDAITRPESTRYSQLSQIIQDNIHGILTGVLSVEEGLDAACIAIDAL
ncbi:MAG: extracellular solute-binding protein [Anaerolineae bacterium]